MIYRKYNAGFSGICNRLIIRTAEIPKIICSEKKAIKHRCCISGCQGDQKPDFSFYPAPFCLIFNSNRMKKLLFIVCLACLTAVRVPAQQVAVKTNALYWLATTPNLGVEVALAPRVTLDISGAYNPWTFSDGKKMRFWLVQPEARYWFCGKFEGHFIGLHAHAAQYFGGFGRHRYDGYLAGGGFTYGYDWILSPHWNLEAALGVGYARLWYKQSDRKPCMRGYENRHKNYFGPTKIAVSFVYIF